MSVDEARQAGLLGGNVANQEGVEQLYSDTQSAQVLDYTIANVAEQRIIVRTVDMELVVPDVNAAMVEIGRIAGAYGGWVVSSNQERVQDGLISIRVPAASLDDALAGVRALADEIKGETSTSQDFTEEFTDLSARAQTLSRTLATLQTLFERAETIEDAISVQEEITRVQSDLEGVQARLNYLEQSSAYSLVTVDLVAKPIEIPLIAGDDLVIAEDNPHQFRVRFTPPPDVTEFIVTWSFGDGSGDRIVNRVAPTANEGEVVSAPVSHTYNSEENSPYIVTVEVSGSGRGGVVSGKDTITATVRRIPAVEVYAGEDLTTDAGKEVKFRGTFTRPEGITDLKAEWNFGDGSAPVVTDLDEGVTAAEATHVYANHRPQAFTVNLNVYGTSSAGRAEGAGTLRVQVEEPDQVRASGFQPGRTIRNGAQVLTNVGSAVATAGLWLLVTSPIWIVIGAAFYLMRHRIRRFLEGENANRRPPTSPSPMPPDSTSVSD